MLPNVGFLFREEAAGNLVTNELQSNSNYTQSARVNSRDLQEKVNALLALIMLGINTKTGNIHEVSSEIRNDSSHHPPRSLNELCLLQGRLQCTKR